MNRSNNVSRRRSGHWRGRESAISDRIGAVVDGVVLNSAAIRLGIFADAAAVPIIRSAENVTAAWKIGNGSPPCLVEGQDVTAEPLIGTSVTLPLPMMA